MHRIKSSPSCEVSGTLLMQREPSEASVSVMNLGVRVIIR
jgi:hypothetical protein